MLRETKTESDDLDLPKKLTDALAHDAFFENNGDGATRKITDNRAKAYDLEYQDRFKRTKLKFPGGAENVSSYDLNGRLGSWTGRGSATVNLTRDDAGRLTAKSWNYAGLSGSSSYTYDGSGRITAATATNPGGNVSQSFSYDSDGRMSSVTSNSRTAQLGYDANGRLQSLTYPAGFAITYVYDQNSRIDQIKKGTLVVADYAYNAKGQLESRADGNGVVTAYTYDKLDRPTSIVVQRGLTVLWSAAYGYDLLGNRTYSQYAGGDGDAYQYDFLGQLTGTKYHGANPQNGYTGITNPAQTETTTYDAAGNRLSHASGSTTVGYTANDLNQYSAITDGSTPTYNSQGSVATFDGGAFSYDASGHLIKAVKNGQTVHYLYDAFGNRAAITRSWGTTSWLHVEGNPIERYLGNVANGYRSFIYAPGIDNLVAEVLDSVTLGYGMVRYFYRDVLGNVVLQVDEQGNVARRNEYDAWGNVTAKSSNGTVVAADEEFYFTSRSYDVETGLYHYRTRAYLPKLGRFLQPDVIDFKGGDLNVYRYVSNNPTNFVDPSGKVWWVPGVMGGGLGVLGGLLSSIYDGNSVAGAVAKMAAGFGIGVVSAYATLTPAGIIVPVGATIAGAGASDAINNWDNDPENDPTIDTDGDGITNNNDDDDDGDGIPDKYDDTCRVPWINKILGP